LNKPSPEGSEEPDASLTAPPRVLMLGWEYPPHITGGLGTACHGLTKALALHHVPITFVIPVARGGEPDDHLTLISAGRMSMGKYSADQLRASYSSTATETTFSSSDTLINYSSVNTVELPSLLQPYWRLADYPTHANAWSITNESNTTATRFSQHYADNLLSEVDRYTQLAVHAALQHEFDIIHAHDWMTFKAGAILKELSGKPLVVHIHSLEYDRCGTHGHGEIHERERLGIMAADAIIAVSAYTKSIIMQEHPVDADRITVVHNGVSDTLRDTHRNTSNGVSPDLQAKAGGVTQGQRKRVLFFGRITLQKGPEFFVEAARKVVSIFPDVLFVMAGQGDMRGQLMERVRQLGLEQNFSFPGFLQGAALDQELSLADLYIMPSKSEPFGISALEAIQRSVPVLLSRQSGVREVILNALSFDFWDVKRLSDLIVNCLEYPELGKEMATQAIEELKALQWEEAARKTCQLYEHLLGRNFLSADNYGLTSSLLDAVKLESETTPATISSRHLPAVPDTLDRGSSATSC
jgi:glycogen synthase